MNNDPLTEAIIAAALKVHQAWGPGYLEAVYRKSLVIELTLRGHLVQTEVPFNLSYEGFDLGTTYRADIVCDGVLLELKSHSGFSNADFAQLLHYLRSARLQRGLLLNFGRATLQIRRLVNGWDDSAFSASSAAVPTGHEVSTSHAQPASS